MLNNRHKYTMLRIIILFLSPVYTVLSFIIKKNDVVILTSSHNMEFSDNSKALFEALIEKAFLKNKIYFVINDEVKREQLNKLYPGCFIGNKKLKHFKIILSAKYWFASALEMPAPGFFNKYFREVYHLGHGMTLKKSGVWGNEAKWYKKIYYKLITSNISYSFVTTDFFKEKIMAIYGFSSNQITFSPQPKTAQIAFPLPVNDFILLDKTATNILHAPTWRPFSDVKLLPFEDLNLSDFEQFLLENNIHLWLRVHPRFEQNIDASIICLKNIHLFSSKKYPEVNEYLSYFDALITDYSSIYFDYLTLKRPVLFFDYDFKEYNKQVGVIDDYEEIKSTQTTSSQQHFIEQLIRVKNGEFDLVKIRAANKLANFDIPNDKILEYLTDKLFKDGSERLQ